MKSLSINVYFKNEIIRCDLYGIISEKIENWIEHTHNDGHPYSTHVNYTTLSNTLSDIPLHTQNPEQYGINILIGYDTNNTTHVQHAICIHNHIDSNDLITHLNTFTRQLFSPSKCTDQHRKVEELAEFNLYGRSDLFKNIVEQIKKMAVCETSVLIQGETGTGKENTARALHYLGPRKNHPFVPVNCAAIPEELIESELFGHEKGAFTGANQAQKGLIEFSDNGTLFLDEIDSLSPKAQAVLLRFIQTGDYRSVGSPKCRRADCNIIAATNTDLRELIKQKKFREDLFFRINVLRIDIPPLRERKEDIERISTIILKKFSEKYNRQAVTLTNASWSWLKNQTWPGNIRELENTLLRAFLLTESDTIHIADSNESTENTFYDPHSNIEDDHENDNIDTLNFRRAKENAITVFEKQYINKILEITGGNISLAAKISGKERRALGRLVKKYNIQRENFRATC